MAQALTGPWGTPGVVGSIGPTTFSRGKQGQTILKAKPAPTNPRTPAQQAGRAMFGFVAKEWAGLDPEDQQSYDEPAASNLIAPFAQYSKDNALRNRQNQAPSQNRAAAAEETPTVPTITQIFGDDGADNAITVEVTAAATDWGVIIYAADGVAPTGIRTEIIAVRKLTTGANEILVSHPGGVDARYGAKTFTVDGALSALQVPA